MIYHGIVLIINALFLFQRVKFLKNAEQNINKFYLIYAIYIFTMITYTIQGNKIHGFELVLKGVLILQAGLMAFDDFKLGSFYLIDLHWLFINSLFYLILTNQYLVLLGGASTYLFFLGIEKFLKGFGSGDKDYAASLSLTLASNLWIYYYLTLTFILAGLVGIIGIAYCNWNRHKKIPLGPFLFIAWLLISLVGRHIF